IYFALSLSGACPEELGYDSTVRRVQGKNGTGPRYIFTIDGKQYITTEAITVRKAKFLLGCATRLFKVQQVLSDKGELDSEVKVIKDYWLPEDSCTELETRSAIEANIQKVNAVPNLNRSAFDRYFVKIEACEKVLVPSTTEKGQTPDSTSNFLRGQTLPSDVKRFTVSAQSSTYQRVMSVSIPASIMMESGPERERCQETVLREVARLDRKIYAPKVHCRQLSEFAGEPLDQMTNWDIVLKALESLIIALSYMHSAGFVHRDISAANVLVKDGNAKLNDLEYSKRVQPAIEPRSASSDVKTGTLFFMPVEVIKGEYLFRPKKHVRKSKSAPSFRYHYIHDLESALWVFVYLLMTRWPISGPSPSEEQQKARDEGFSKIFIFERREEILDGGQTMVDLVSESMPELFDSAWDCALELAAVVKEKYCALQESLPIDFNNAFHPSLYSDWRRAFIRCATEGWAGVVTHRGRTKRSTEDDLKKETKKSKVT
ncbi:kinase-like domain-containing protein, partial [Lentinula edodes]